ncbi:catalase family peroxidase [Nocardioides sp.]|uniref:catalase family peroxidase n=1 Tax=Nocardioides sp. TaxID=35761 RepID=UPI0035271868
MIEPTEAVDRIAAATGSQPGSRTLHAKGWFFEGTFTASPEAAALCRAGHLQGDPVPVQVRWSNGAGHPRNKDSGSDVRGMAVKFLLPDGSATDLLGQTAPYFPVRTPEDFVELTEAVATPWKLPLFLALRPATAMSLLGNFRAGALRPPRSYAEATYFPIHAYRWVAAGGDERWVRYRIVPVDAPAGRPAGEFAGRDRLREEILARLERGPVVFDLRVTLAGPDDDPHDPMSQWGGQADLSAGRIEVTAAVPDPEGEGAVVVFDPTRVVDGIELSDDPILLFRPAAYSVSVDRRV